LLLTRLGSWFVGIVFREARPLTQQLVLVSVRMMTIVVVLTTAARAAQSLGLPVTALVAGLGVGGLAIALAAQSTLENLIGGIILYADQPARIGDICRFGGHLGTVEKIGLRSVKIRTLARTIVNVPNAQFAKMELENFSTRDRIFLDTRLRLRYETSREQLRQVHIELEELLKGDPRIAENPVRVRFMGFGEYFLEVEIHAYALTRDWSEFLAIRQELLVRSMEIVERAGTRLALPATVHYVGSERDSKRQKDDLSSLDG
jgi:small-conductance mechanosensitive channel